MATSGSGTGTPVTTQSAIVRTTPDDTAPLLPLDEFRRMMGMNPWHFWQLENDAVPARDSCSPVLFNYAWQNVDALGRQDILAAIASAEDKFTREAGFAPAPEFRRDVLDYPQHYDARQRAGGWDARQNWPALRLPVGRVQALGVERLDFVAEAPVTYSDADGDGIAETFTVIVATTETDARNIAVYFTPADRVQDVATARRWQVRPVVVSIAGGVAMIRGRAWTAVRPILGERYSPAFLNPSDAGNFAARLQVWRRSIYTGNQGELIWETVPGAACTEGADPSGYSTATARYTIRDAPGGLVAGGAAEYNTTAAAWVGAAWPVSRTPTHAAVNSYAGYAATSGGNMAPTAAQMIARLAAAELPRPICGCHDQNREFNYWQTDISKVSGGPDELFQISQQDLDNCPWGTRRGHVTVYKLLQDMKRRYGISTA